MSAMSNPVRSRSLLPHRLPRPRLTIVPKVASRAPRVPFVILVVMVLGAGLIGLLLLNTALQRGAYEVSDLRTRSAGLAAEQQTLELRVSALRQPHRVAEAALALGMVRNDSPAFLDVVTGAVSGSVAPAVAPDAPVVGVKRGLTPSSVEKPMLLVAGAGASEADEFVRVPRVREQKSVTDTRPTSADPPVQRVRNNTSNTR